MTEKEKIIDQLLDSCESIVRSTIGCVKDRKYMIPLCIFLTIIDTSHDISLLYKNKRLVSITALLRGVIDSLFDLFLIRKDINNANFLFYIDIKNSVKRLEHKLNRENIDFIKDKKERNKIRSQLNDKKKMLKQLEIEGYASKSHKDKFVRANAEYFHRTVFQYFNVEVHNSISTIEKRHFKMGSDGKITLSYMQEYTEEEYPVFNYISLSLLFAASNISQILQVDSVDILKSMIASVNSQLDDIIVDYDDLVN